MYDALSCVPRMEQGTKGTKHSPALKASLFLLPDIGCFWDHPSIHPSIYPHTHIHIIHAFVPLTTISGMSTMRQALNCTWGTMDEVCDPVELMLLWESQRQKRTASQEFVKGLKSLRIL